MKKLIFFTLTFFTFFAFGQNKTEAEKLVKEGVSYHDKGDYQNAISKYNKALELDKDNLLALAEKAFSLMLMEKYDDAIKCCTRAIATHENDKLLENIYVTYGNALDGLKKTDQSLEIYDEGIKKFPESFMMHFNKGISLFSQKEYEDALLCFEKAVLINPDHAGSHNAIARLEYLQDKRIPAILAYCRFFTVEPESRRAQENLEVLKTLVRGNAKKTGKNTISINLDTSTMGDTTADGKNKPDNFSSAELILELSARLQLTKDHKKKNEVDEFVSKMETLASLLNDSEQKNSGFFWEYYTPFLVDMKDKKMMETFGYVVYASSGESYVKKWLKKHPKELEAFFIWSSKFDWKIE